MAVDLTILYRGPLSSCNYECWYCPFAKRVDSDEQLREDRAALERFVGWVADRAPATTSVLFTPWGEALVRRWYREAFVALSRMPHVRRVAVQTNISMGLGWLDRCDRRAAALWCTFHPSQTSVDLFLRRCGELQRLGVRFSVGCVGLAEDIETIEELRQRLDPDIYLWVNAYKRQENYYTPELFPRFEAVDPLFSLNTVRYASRGRACRTGHSVISVDGDGTIRRCHFVKDAIGNIYDLGFETSLRRRSCTADTCGCHIGYVHIDDLKLDAVFGDGLLERLPAIDVRSFEGREAARGIAQHTVERETLRATGTPAIGRSVSLPLAQVSVAGR